MVPGASRATTSRSPTAPGSAAALARGSQTLHEVVGPEKVVGPRIPLVQIPTTAGTGSEVTAIAIVTTPSQEKKGVVSPVLYPDIALLDGELTIACGEGAIRIEELQRAKPAAAKGRYFRKVTVASTMGPGIKVDPNRPAE